VSERIVVIGGGVVGASAAYRLAAAGVRTTLVDRADPGQATAAGAGIVAPAASAMPDGPWFELAREAVAHYPGLLERLLAEGEPETGYEAVGGLVVAMDEAEGTRLDEMQRLIQERKRAGMGNVGDVTRLGPAETRSLFPPIAPAASAVHLSGAARVNGRLLRDAMTRAASKLGADVRHGSATVLIERGTVSGVQLDDDEGLACDAVIMAGGAWTGALTATAGGSVPVEPQRGQIAHLDMPAEATGRWPFVVCFHHHYLLTFPEHRVVAGATREHGSGFDHRVTAAGVREVLGEALRVAPGLAGATVVDVRVGFRPVTPDGLPILGPIEGVAGAYVATGMGPTGLTVGPFGGALVADLAMGIEPKLDITPFLASRFGTGG
jgi:D-amino-acid dehydrogenase